MFVKKLVAPGPVTWLTVSAIGQILGPTVMLETATIMRFDKLGNCAAYCRCVGSHHLTNGKLKGRGNTKNGNKYLAWAFVEAAHFAVRYNPQIKSYYQCKAARSNAIVGIKTGTSMGLGSLYGE